MTPEGSEPELPLPRIEKFVVDASMVAAGKFAGQLPEERLDHPDYFPQNILSLDLQLEKNLGVITFDDDVNIHSLWAGEGTGAVFKGDLFLFAPSCVPAGLCVTGNIDCSGALWAPEGDICAGGKIRIRHGNLEAGGSIKADYSINLDDEYAILAGGDLECPNGLVEAAAIIAGGNCKAVSAVCTGWILEIGGDFTVSRRANAPCGIVVGGSAIVGEDIHTDGSIKVGGDLNAKDGISAHEIDAKNISTLRSLYANDDVSATHDITSGGKVVSRYGNIRAGENIVAADDLSAPDGWIEAKGAIRTGPDKNTNQGGMLGDGGAIRAEAGLQAGGDIISYKGIDSGGDISSDGCIYAEDGIRAGGSIRSKRTISAGGNIFAGATSEKTRYGDHIFCQRVISGRVRTGRLVSEFETDL